MLEWGKFKEVTQEKTDQRLQKLIIDEIIFLKKLKSLWQSIK